MDEEMYPEPVVYLREIDGGTDNACVIVCAKGDPGSFPAYCLWSDFVALTCL